MLDFDIAYQGETMLCNPWFLPELIEDRCTLCGLCAEACPNHGICLDDRGPVFERREQCDACGTCEDVCPEGAIVTEFEIAENGGSHSAEGGQDA
jgi:MinD superfamily P-loop ATPase